MTIYRAIYFFVIFLILIKFLIRDKLDSFQVFTNIFLISLVLLISMILIQLPFFRENYLLQNEIELSYLFKPFSYLYISSFFALLAAFSAIMFSVEVRSILKYPTLKRLKKVVNYTVFSQFVFYMIIGMVGYYCLGDRFTPQLIILRKSLNPNSVEEIIIKFLLLMFFTSSVLSLAIFNVPFKNYLILIFHQKQSISKNWRYFYSIFPFFCIVVLAFFLSDVIFVFSFLGLTVWNIDTFLFPILIKIKLIDDEDRFRKSKVVLLLVLLIFITIISITAIYNKIINGF